MEMNLNRGSAAVCELLLNTAAEHPIECDLLLPDYCPDIVRLLCCRVCSSVADCTVQQSTLTVEGMALVQLCYVGEVGGVRKTEYRVPFSKSFALEREPVSPIWSVGVEPGQMNHRAVSRRRVDLRGTLLLRVKLFDAAEQPVVTGAQGMGVQLRLCEKPAARITGQLQRGFGLAELLTPQVGKRPPAEMVQLECAPILQESRVVAGRVVLKGELMAHLLYKTDLESGELESCDYQLPFSQVLEADGLTDDLQCEAQLYCLSCECAVEEGDGQGELRLEVQLLALLRLYAPVVLSGAVDSYSTLYPTQNTLAQLRVPTRCTPLAERAVVRQETDLPEDAQGVADVWAQVFGQRLYTEQGQPQVQVQIRFTALVASAELGVDCVTHLCETSIAIACEGAASDILCDVTPLSARGSISQGKLLLSCELLLSGLLLEFETQSLLTDLQVDAEHPRQNDPQVGLTVYYAQAGEHVWDISKRYGAMPAQVMADNELTAELLEAATPLMIPTV